MSAPRLTAEQKSEIAAAYAAGEALTSIARRFGISPTYPGLLARRRAAKQLREALADPARFRGALAETSAVPDRRRAGGA